MPSNEEIEQAQTVLAAAKEEEEKRKEALLAETNALVQKYIADTFKQPVAKFVQRSGETVGYNAFSRLDFGRSIESTMFFSATLANNAIFHFGIGSIRNAHDASILMQHPDGTKGFLCINRTYNVKSNDAQQEKRDFWIKCSKLFGQKLSDFEAIISNTARDLCYVTGMDYDKDVWRAPVKKRVVTFVWE